MGYKSYVNENTPALCNRLTACADFARAGAVVADVGTDHALLPVMLIKRGKIQRAVACDLNEQPLKRAAKTVRQYDCADKIKLILCDGLAGVAPTEFTDVVIAGLGGQTIIHIISAAPFLKSEGYRLILQPMTKDHLLRKFLLQNGWQILDEKAAEDSGKVYAIIHAKYSGEKTQPDEFFCRFGHFLNKNDQASIAYKARIKRGLEKQAKGLQKANFYDQKAAKILKFLEKI